MTKEAHLLSLVCMFLLALGLAIGLLVAEAPGKRLRLFAFMLLAFVTMSFGACLYTFTIAVLNALFEGALNKIFGA